MTCLHFPGSFQADGSFSFSSKANTHVGWIYWQHLCAHTQPWSPDSQPPMTVGEAPQLATCDDHLVWLAKHTSDTAICFNMYNVACALCVCV